MYRGISVIMYLQNPVWKIYWLGPLPNSWTSTLRGKFSIRCGSFHFRLLRADFCSLPSHAPLPTFRYPALTCTSSTLFFPNAMCFWFYFSNNSGPITHKYILIECDYLFLSQRYCCIYCNYPMATHLDICYTLYMVLPSVPFFVTHLALVHIYRSAKAVFVPWSLTPSLENPSKLQYRGCWPSIRFPMHSSLWWGYQRWWIDIRLDWCIYLLFKVCLSVTLYAYWWSRMMKSIDILPETAFTAC